jgi:hypothetical protein
MAATNVLAACAQLSKRKNMAKVEILNTAKTYPNKFSDMEIGDYALIPHNNSNDEVIVIRCFYGDFQMLNHGDAWNSGTELDCRILLKGTVIQITI